MQPRTMDKYRKIKKERTANDKTQENEVRISAGRRTAGYVIYAARLLLEREKDFDQVILKASGLAAGSAVQVAEVLRHNITGLHQINKISTVEVVDEYEPLEEGLDRVTIKRNLAVLEIRLTRRAGVFDAKDAGYQGPIEVSAKLEEELRNVLEKKAPYTLGGEGERRGPRGGRGRGGFRPRGSRGFGGGRGRGGRGGFGGRGRGRGGFGGRGRGGPREGGDYRGPREGGYRGPREGGDSRGPREGGDSRGPRPQGGYRGPREGGDNRGPRPQGGYRGPREGGDNRGPRPQGGYRGPREGGDNRGPRPQGGYRGPREGGDNRGPRPQGGYRGPREGGDSRGPAPRS